MSVVLAIGYPFKQLRFTDHYVEMSLTSTSVHQYPHVYLLQQVQTKSKADAVEYHLHINIILTHQQTECGCDVPYHNGIVSMLRGRRGGGPVVAPKAIVVDLSLL